MEGTNASCSNWEWQNELLATFDADSPLGTSHTLWEDINQGEREMLEATPASKHNHANDEFIWDSKDNNNFSNELSHEDTLHFKRRRMLQFQEEEDIGIFACDPSLDILTFNSLETYDVHEAIDSHMFEPTSTKPIWFEKTINDGSNMKRCSNIVWQEDSSKNKICETQESLQRKTHEVLPIVGIDSTIDDSKLEEEVNDRSQSNRILQPKRNLSGESTPNKMAIQVVYPFTVVKPSGIQGDATLNDINKHIKMVHKQSRLHGKCHCEGDAPFTSILEKPVIALTKIHTEGNGTITILRTKK